MQYTVYIVYLIIKVFTKMDLNDFVPYGDKPAPYEIADISYMVPFRYDENPKDGLANPGEKGKREIGGFKLTDVSGDGYCGSYAVTLQVDKPYKDVYYVEVPQLLAGVMLKTNALYIMIYAYDLKVLFIAKSSKYHAHGIVKVMHSGEHYMKIDELPKVLPQTCLQVNWAITRDEINLLVGYRSLSPYVNMVVDREQLPMHRVITTIYEKSLYLHLTEDEMKCLIKNSPDDMKNMIIDYLTNPRETAKAHSLQFPITPFTKESFMDVYAITPIIMVNGLAYSSNGIGAQYNQTGLFANRSNQGNRGDPKILPRTVEGAEEYYKTIREEDEFLEVISKQKKKKEEKKLSAKQRLKHHRAKAFETIVKREEYQVTSTSSSSWPTLSYKSINSTSDTKALFVSYLRKSKIGDNVVKILDYYYTEHGSSIMSKILTGTNSEMVKLDKIWNSHVYKDVAICDMLLFIRGLVFENLVKYHKQNYSEEQTFLDFIIKLNTHNPDITKKVFLQGLHNVVDEKTMVEFMDNVFSGKEKTDMISLVCRKTPDIMSIELGGKWYSFVVCDPSSASTPYFRRIQKRIKYSDYRKLVKPDKMVDFLLENPVVDQAGTNIYECLSEVKKVIDVDVELVKAATKIIQMCSNHFRFIRQASPEATDYYTHKTEELDMGELKDIDYNKYLNERDYILSGLDKDDMDKVFSDAPLTFEDEASKDSFELEVVELLKQSRKDIIKNDSALAKREDIFVKQKDKLRVVTQAFNDLKEPVKGAKKMYSPDLMGYIPALKQFKPVSFAGMRPALDTMKLVPHMDNDQEWLIDFLKDVGQEIDNVGDQAYEALKLFPKRDRMVRYKMKQKDILTSLESVNKSLRCCKITDRDTIRPLGINNINWKKMVLESKTKRSSKPFLVDYNSKSINRIENLISELEDGDNSPNLCLEYLLGRIGALDLGPRGLGKLNEYFKSNGSQSMMSLHRMASELNIAMSRDTKEGEMIVTNLGTEDLVAIIAPGVRLRDNNYTRLVKFIIKEDQILKNQGLKGESFNGWFITEGFFRITKKVVAHLINMPLCLVPLYNEQQYSSDSKHDMAFKRSLTQLYWMAGDSVTNKILGVVRYLSLLVFSVVCRPDVLIRDELSCDELAWRKDIHIYTIHKMSINLPRQIKAVGSIRSVLNQSSDTEELQRRQEIKMPRLLHNGHHNSFKDMLNEFYMYYTWNKSQTSQFEGSKKVTNKLLKSRDVCLPFVEQAIKHIDENPEDFDKIELHINTGIRIGFPEFANEYSDNIKDCLKYILSECKESQQGVGFAPFLSYATDSWITEMNADETLKDINFQPLRKGIEVLSNTRGSLKRTKQIDQDLPLLSSSLKRMHDHVLEKEEEEKVLQRHLASGEITYEEFRDQLNKCRVGAVDFMTSQMIEDEDIVIEEKLSQFDKARSILDLGEGRTSAIKRRVTKHLTKMGYDCRSKCILTTLDSLINLGKYSIEKSTKESLYMLDKITIDKMLVNFIKNRSDMIHGISPKTQHLSDRELRIMDIESKAGMLVVEELARHLNRLDRRETSQTDKMKQLTQQSHSQSTKKIVGSGRALCIKLSADKSKWGPSVLPTEFLTILRRISKRIPHLAEICRLSMYMVIKLQSKRVLIPKELLSHWWTYSLDMERLNVEIPHLYRFLQSFDPTKRCSFDNVNDMGQGIMNAFTSFKHLATTTYSQIIYHKIVPETELTKHFCLLSSDDSHEQQTFDKRYAKEHLEIWLTVKACCWRMANMIHNKKKTAGCEDLSEYNSNFNLPPLSAPPNIKQIVAAGMVNFQYSWAQTVRSKLSEIKSASENGVTNNTCRLINIISKKFYEDLFGIEKVRKVVYDVLDLKDRAEVIPMMESGSIEFGRFPLVDIVKLNLLGSFELMKDSLRYPRQVDLLTKTTNNPFITNNLEIEEDERGFNTIGMKSFRLKLFREERLEKERKKYNEIKELVDPNFDNEVMDRNFLSPLTTPQTLAEQLYQLTNTLNSESMHTAFSHFDSLSGMIRVMGLRYKANYGMNGTPTRDLSFTLHTALLNIATIYHLPCSESPYEKLFDETSDHKMMVGSIQLMLKSCERVDSGLIKLNRQMTTLKEICDNSLEEINKVTDVGEMYSSNPIEPTLIRKPEWNNQYLIKSNIPDLLKYYWKDDLPNLDFSTIPVPTEYDLYVLEHRFNVPRSISSVYEQWGINKRTSSLASIASWITRMVKSSYKASKPIYGRGTSSSGFRRLAADMYSFNVDNNYVYEPVDITTNSPKRWRYSDELYDFLVGCSIILPVMSTHSEFRNCCIFAKTNLEKKMGIELEIPPEIVSDKSIHSDIRFVCAAILNSEQVGVSNTIKEHLASCVISRSHRYIKRQRKVDKSLPDGKLSSYQPDTDCKVEYLSSTLRAVVECQQGRMPGVILQSDPSKLNMKNLHNCVKDFFNDRALFSWISNLSVDNKKYKALKQYTIKGKILGHISIGKELKFSQTPFHLSVPIVVVPKSETGKMPNPEVPDIKLNWDDRRFELTNVRKAVQSVFHEHVLWHSGSLHHLMRSTAATNAVVNSMIRLNSNLNYANTLAIWHTLQSRSEIINSDEFEGAALIACKHMSDPYEFNYTSYDDVVIGYANLLSLEKLRVSLNERGYDVAKIEKDIDFDPSFIQDSHRESIQSMLLDPNDEEDIGRPIFSFGHPFLQDLEEYELVASTVEVPDTFETIPNKPTGYEEMGYREGYNMGEMVTYDTGKYTASQHIDSAIRKATKQWKDFSMLLEKTEDPIIDHINKRVAYTIIQSVSNVLKEQLAEDNPEQWMENIQEANRLGSAVVESYNCLSYSIPIELKPGSVQDYIDYYDHLCERVYDMYDVDLNEEDEDGEPSPTFDVDDFRETVKAMIHEMDPLANMYGLEEKDLEKYRMTTYIEKKKAEKKKKTKHKKSKKKLKW